MRDQAVTDTHGVPTPRPTYQIPVKLGKEYKAFFNTVLFPYVTSKGQIYLKNHNKYW